MRNGSVETDPFGPRRQRSLDRRTKRLAFSMLLWALLVGALSASMSSAQEAELPPGSVTLLGEIAGGTLVERPAPAVGSDTIVAVDDNEFVLVLIEADAATDGPVMGEGTIRTRRRIALPPQREGDPRDEYVLTESAEIDIDGTWTYSDAGKHQIDATIGFRFAPSQVEIVTGYTDPPPLRAPQTGTLTASYISRERHLDGDFTAGPITGKIRATTQSIASAPRVTPSLLIGDGPYGIDMAELAAVIGPCEDLRRLDDTLGPSHVSICEGLLERGHLEHGPKTFAGRLMLLAFWLGPTGVGTAPAFGIPGVLQVVDRLVEKVMEDPSDPARMTALVRFFNYCTGIHQ